MRIKLGLLSYPRSSAFIGGSNALLTLSAPLQLQPQIDRSRRRRLCIRPGTLEAGAIVHGKRHRHLRNRVADHLAVSHPARLGDPPIAQRPAPPPPPPP